MILRSALFIGAAAWWVLACNDRNAGEHARDAGNFARPRDREASDASLLAPGFTIDASVMTPAEVRADAGTVDPTRPAAEAGPADAIHGDSGIGVPATEAPWISNLTLEANPNNVLSCFVNFQTSAPARVEVRFGKGEPEFRVRSDEVGTQHRVLLIGMHADTEYAVSALAENDRGSHAERATFKTSSLPSEVPVPVLTHSAPGFLPGWTLTNAQIDAGASGRETMLPAVFVMVDESGIPVWYYINGSTRDVRGDIAVEVMSDGNVMVGPAPGEPAKELDLAGNVVWQGPAQPTTSGVPFYHHEAKRLDDGTYVVLRDGGGVTVEHYDGNTLLLSSWTLSDHFAATGSGDWCHGNSLTVDLDEDVMYLNCRWEGTFKIRWSTGELVWFLSGTLNPETQGDIQFEPEEGRFSDAHDPEFHDDGTLLLYDNRYGTGHSRVVEYALDQPALVATLVWEFPGDFDVDPWYRDDWYSVIWGDADRLENGNVLVNAGVRTGEQSRIFEVTRDGQVVWELRMREGIGTYRAQRISTPPLVERIEL